MSHRAHVEHVDRTLKDLRNVMGEVTFVFVGDYRQTLPLLREERMQISAKPASNHRPFGISSKH